MISPETYKVQLLLFINLIFSGGGGGISCNWDIGKKLALLYKSSRQTLNGGKFYKLGQNIIDKPTKLRTIGFSME